MKKRINILMAIALMFSVVASSFSFDADAAVVSQKSGWQLGANKKYSYIDAKGNKVIGWNKINGLWHYFNSNGEMVVGQTTIGGKTYAFNNDGSLKGEIKSQKASTNTSNTSSTQNGKTVYYDKKGNVLGTGKKYVSNASAYTGDTTTASGQRPRWGTIAVDPKVIPLGSKVYVPYFDKVFIANDTGGIIRGTMIDIFMTSSSQMYNFGRRNLDIIVLDK